MDRTKCPKSLLLDRPAGVTLKYRVTIPVLIPSWNEVLSLCLKERLRLKAQIKDTSEKVLFYDSSAIERF